MKLLKFIFVILFIPILLYGQNTKRRFDNVVRNISNSITKNYQTENLQNVEHFEVTYNSQKELLESVYIDGVQITPILLWDLNQEKLRHKSGHPHAKNGLPYFHAELFTTNRDGTLVTKNELMGVSMYASQKPYLPISRIFMNDFLLPSLTNNNREIGTNPMSFSVEKKTLSSEKTDDKWYIIDTLYNSEICLKLVYVECVNYFFTEQDSLDLINCPFMTMGARSENEEITKQIANTRNKNQEIIKFWNGGKICVQETFIVNKKDNAVLFFQSLKEATDNIGRNFSEHFFTEFEKQGKNYVPKKFFFNGHNYIENTSFFSQSGNQTLIIRTPSSNSKPLTDAKFYNRYNYLGSIPFYLRFCDILKEPSSKMLEFWERHKDIAK